VELTLKLWQWILALGAVSVISMIVGAVLIVLYMASESSKLVDRHWCGE
jgi:uncharacterized integral membrane protein